jgi:hypothetical protein
MASTSETSFGAKLGKAQDLVTYITGFTGYAPPRAQESVASMTTLINSIVAINATESSQQENYKVAVNNRQAAFSKKTGSVDKLLSPIKGAVDAQYGKKSIEATTINAIIKKMRATKLIKVPADPTKPEQAAAISQSERSYGSITQSFNDIINTLSQFTDYAPTNNTIKVATLQTLATQLTTLNNAVIQKIQPLETTRATRLTQYTDLKDRVQRIKSYVKAQYGNSSTEYNMIKGISI